MTLNSPKYRNGFRSRDLGGKSSGPPVPDADGEETESENFADLIGIDIAYETYLKWVEENGEEAKLPGLPYTPTQLFWIQFGTANCFKKVDSTEWTVLENRHAP
ncbi:hypothetical protein NQ318_006375 [Aromia moschata]|uniref:Peptidase M13 C-terminal domain-containing protein n=1 Tax=Aromia moschata TaxID=1265417 RepID=A0AAV8YIK7_9CUCU|nr:hypothetical protein NQ318_006375 [Aromia moschata]